MTTPEPDAEKGAIVISNFVASLQKALPDLPDAEVIAREYLACLDALMAVLATTTPSAASAAALATVFTSLNVERAVNQHSALVYGLMGALLAVRNDLKDEVLGAPAPSGSTGEHN